VCSLLSILSLCSPAPAATSAASSVPQHRADELGARFVAGVNRADAAFRAAVAREILSPASLAGGGEQKFVELLGRLQARYDSLTFHHGEAIRGGEEASPRLSLHVYARSTKDGGWKDFQFMLDASPPHRIQNLVFVADVAEPVYLPNGDISQRATLDWLGGYVDRLVAQNDLAGGLLIAQGDRVLFERTFGFADSAKQRRMGPRTRFNLGSGGKMFTSVCIARLVEAGRLKYSDALISRLPSVAAEKWASGVTIAQLLAHTSGIAEFWTDEYERDWDRLRRLSDFLPYVRKAGSSAPPGTRFEYSNSNYILLGLVLEAVSRKTYDQVLAEHIFTPLAMRDTGLFPFDDRDTLQAQRLSRAPGGGWRKAPHGYKGSSAGGALSTMPDMLRFARGLVGGRLVTAATLQGMTATKTASLPTPGMPYGYGFEPAGGGPTRSFGHGGIAAGVNFELRHFPESNITLIAFSNQDNGAYDDLRRNTTKLITGDR
jgi:CubicO group peptidase (beta-lactamase class C family)